MKKKKKKGLDIMQYNGKNVHIRRNHAHIFTLYEYIFTLYEKRHTFGY